MLTLSNSIFLGKYYLINLFVYSFKPLSQEEYGFTKDKETLLNQHKDVVKYLRQGRSVRNTMKLTGKSGGTVQKIKGLIG